jgi:hypothetical protein
MQETNKKHSKQQEHKKINSEVSVIDLHRACMEIHYEFRAVFFARVWPIQLDVLDRVFGETVAPRYAAIFDYQRGQWSALWTWGVVRKRGMSCLTFWRFNSPWDFRGGPIIFRYQTRMETYMDIFLDTFGSKEKGIPAVSYDFQILPGTHK